jgi:AcrR family transcriptional regulator
MSTPPVPQLRTAAPRDRDAYFAAAVELLVVHGCDSVTVSALCDRLGVTKGSFYHHFADMPDFVAGFAKCWEGWTAARAQEYAAISDPLVRLERMHNDLPDLFFGVDRAVRVWGRIDPVLAVVLGNVQRLMEEVGCPAIGQILGVDSELGALWGRMSYCLLVGLQLRLEPIDPERYLTAACVIGRRAGLGIELVRTDGRLQTRFTHVPPRSPGRPGWGQKPNLPGTPSARPARPSPDGQPQRPGPRDREAYFAAAWALLGARGSDAVTLLALCDHLSVSKGSFQHHFGSMPKFVAALADHWAERSSARLDAYRTPADPWVRLSRLLQSFLGGPDPAGSAWRAWGHVDPVIGAVIAPLERNRRDLLARTLTEVCDDPTAAEPMAEITEALLIGLKQPGPGVGPDEAAWMAFVWARRVLGVEPALQPSRGTPELVVRGNWPL